MRDHYARCRAFLFPGEEDIGLTPIEAQACGRPVIAYARGGALETVCGFYPDESIAPESSTGIFFREQSVDSMVEAIQAFEAVESLFSPRVIRAQAERFDVSCFRSKMRAFISESVADFQKVRRGSGPVNRAISAVGSVID